MSKKSLVKSTGVIGIATLISRILGFIRDVVMANFFGTGLAIEAFVVAFRIPNMLRDIVGEGATNSAIVPVLTEYKTKEKNDFWVVAQTLFNISFVLILVISVFGIVFSPLVVKLIAPGFISHFAKFDLTVKLNQIIFPYLIFIGLTAYAMGVLNTLNHFAAPAFSQSILNLTLIISAIFLSSKIGVFSLAVGVLAGGALQLAVCIPPLYLKGFRFGRRFNFRHSAVKKIGVLMLPRIAGTAVYQINVFISTILASFYWIVGQGAVAGLYFANRLIQFPFAIFSLALAQAALPRMSQEAAENNLDKLKDTLTFSLRAIFLVILPSAVGLLVLGEPIVRIIFQHGQFDAYSTKITQNALFFYCLGLCSFSGIKILVNAFYSLKDTFTPVKIAAGSVALNIILSLILMHPMKIGGLALATSISATFNFFLLYIMLQRKIGRLEGKRIMNGFLKILIASIIMGIVADILFKKSKSISGAFIFEVITLFSVILISTAVYFLIAHLLKIEEVGKFFKWLLKRQ